MASILKVDELQGITSAGDITVTSEGGTATQSLQQGLVKCWTLTNGSQVLQDSLNCASITDNGTGDFDINRTNAMSNATYAASAVVAANGVVMINDGAGDYTTSVTRVFTKDTSAVAGDYNLPGVAIHGDLA